MKILFLDFDGVLNNYKSMARAAEGSHPPSGTGFLYTVDPKCVVQLLLLLNQAKYVKADLKIVVSSSWRGYNKFSLLEGRGTNIANAITWAAKELDVDKSLILDKFIDWTDHNTFPEEIRGHEIQRWVDKHPEVTEYAIIDDDSDMLPSQKPYYVSTEYSKGWLPKHTVALRAILKLNA